MVLNNDTTVLETPGSGPWISPRPGGWITPGPAPRDPDPAGWITNDTWDD